MTLPLLPTAGLEDVNFFRRVRETINNILQFTFDDSRVRTAAEIAVNVIVLNPAYPPGDVRRYGAVGDNSTDNSVALQAAIDVCEYASIEMFVPAGVFLHASSLSITDASLDGFRIRGVSSGDYGTSAGNAPTRGSILKYTGAGTGITIDSGAATTSPKYVEIDGITFVGNSGADDGVLITRATWVRFSRCGWFGYSQTNGNAVRLTIGSGTFTGAIRFYDCWWSSNERCVYADTSPINILSFIRCDFHSNVYAFYHGATGASYYIRHLKFIDSHFEENDQDILINGGVAGFSVIESYFEQNDNAQNNPRIQFAATGSSPLSGAVRIIGNEFSKQLQGATQRLIHLAYCDGVTIRDNWSAYGDQTDRYWVEVGTSVANYDIEPARVVSGVTAYPIRISGANWTQRVSDQAAPIVFRSGGATVFYPRSSDAASDTSQQGYLDQITNNQSGNYTLALTDRNKTVWNGNNTGITYTIPANATTAFPLGTQITIINDATAGMTLARAVGVAQILASTATDQDVTIASRGMAFLRKIDTNRWYVSGTGLT